MCNGHCSLIAPVAGSGCSCGHTVLVSDVCIYHSFLCFEFGAPVPYLTAGGVVGRTDEIKYDQTVSC